MKLYLDLGCQPFQVWIYKYIDIYQKTKIIINILLQTIKYLYKIYQMNLKNIILNELHLINEDTLNECVIAAVRLPGETILAKNRDRGYKADIEIVHEIIDGVEIVYWHDRKTDWSEGMNEFGIGIINSTLSVVSDEKEGTDKKSEKGDFDKKGKGGKPSYDGLKIRTALKEKSLIKVIKTLISYTGEDKKDVGVKGETIVATPKDIFVIENTSEHAPIITKINDESKIVVRTNHGIFHKDAGYTSGMKKKSSQSRMKLAKTHLRDAKKDTDVLNILHKQYIRNNVLNPYRRDNKFKMHTTGQIMMNLDKKEVTVRMDKKYGEFDGYVNLLPEGYDAKIKVNKVKFI